MRRAVVRLYAFVRVCACGAEGRGVPPATITLQHQTRRINLPACMHGSVCDTGHVERWQGGARVDKQHALALMIGRLIGGGVRGAEGCMQEGGAAHLHRREELGDRMR